MKKLTFFALAAITTAAYALNETPQGAIVINGTSNQLASVNNYSTVANTSNAGTFAAQNQASNQGEITINGYSSQTSGITGSTVTNTGNNAGDVAVQSLASNVGTVTVGYGAYSVQNSYIENSTMVNEASGNGCTDCDENTATAFQNGASNFGDIKINNQSYQTLGVSGNSTVSNKAWGSDAVAVQNLSSNYGDVTINGVSSQTTYIGNHSLVANLANGTGSAAYQNLASNDYCMPPPPVCVGPVCGPFSSYASR